MSDDDKPPDELDERDPAVRKDAAQKARQQRKEIEHAMQLFETNRDHFDMSQRQVAIMYFVRYSMFVEAGFTEEQAMDIIKIRGLA